MTEQNGLERSSATEELRRMLDEHGIEYCGGEIMTYTEDAEYMPSENNTFDVTLYHLTPAQAVEATLGRGTCEILGYDDGYDEGLDGEMYQYADPRYFLSCEHEAYGSVVPNYCPVCGRKVVDE